MAGGLSIHDLGGKEPAGQHGKKGMVASIVRPMENMLNTYVKNEEVNILCLNENISRKQII